MDEPPHSKIHHLRDAYQCNTPGPAGFPFEFINSTEELVDWSALNILFQLDSPPGSSEVDTLELGVAGRQQAQGVVQSQYGNWSTVPSTVPFSHVHHQFPSPSHEIPTPSPPVSSRHSQQVSNKIEAPKLHKCSHCGSLLSSARFR